MPFGVALGLGAAGSIANGIIGSNAANSAASAQRAAANQASQTEMSMFNTAQTDLQPWMQGGNNALASLQKMLGIGPGGGGATSPLLQMLGIGANGQSTGGINPTNFQGSPGYQYQLNQNMNAVTNSAAARGGLGGNALKQLQSTGQGLANQDWSQYLSQLNTGWQGLVGNLTGLSGQGMSAAGDIGNAAMKTGAEVGGNQIGAGNATAGGTIGSANAISGSINDFLKNLTTGANGPGGLGGNNNGGNNNSLLYALLNQGGSPIPGQPSDYAGQMVNTSGWGTSQ